MMAMLDLDPGKYAAFLWPAFGLSALVLIWMTVDSLLRSRHWQRKAQRLEALRDQTRGDQAGS
jgi:heme exporter protein D